MVAEVVAWKAFRYIAPAMVAAAIAAHHPALAIETSTAASTAASVDVNLEPDPKTTEKDRREIESLLKSIENEWNAHNLDAVMMYYADDYINNDGLDKAAVSSLTKEFWDRYPDARFTSRTKEIRVDGSFATVESRDVATGTTEKENSEIGSKGELVSISEGQLYLKKQGPSWKITGDRVDYEKVRVSFGLAKQLNANFSAPEQVKSGRSYSARLDVSLPVGLSAVGSITSQTLEYPQPPPTDAWRPLDGSTLERIMPANKKNRNELLMATIGITNASRSHLMGITVLTRRLNVVPEAEESADRKKKDDETLTKAEQGGKARDKTGDKTKSESGEKKQSDAGQPQKTETKSGEANKDEPDSGADEAGKEKGAQPDKKDDGAGQSAE